jgi:zinc transporter ZupT
MVKWPPIAYTCSVRAAFIGDMEWGIVMSIHGQWLAIITSILAAAAIVLGARFVLVRRLDSSAELRLGKLFAFGTGVLFVAVILDFLPDAWEMAKDKTPWGIFAGILLLWILTQLADRLFARHQLAGRRSPNESTGSETVQFTAASAVVLAVSLSAHSLLEGAALAVATKQVTLSGGVFVAAMLLHKLPEGILWGLALYKAMPDAVSSNPNRIRYTLMIPAVCTLAGTIAGITFLNFASSSIIAILSALLCGAMIFICLGELFPMLRESAGAIPINKWFFAGIITMLVPLGIALFADKIT